MPSKTHSLYKIAEVALVYKSRIRASERPKITKSDEAYAVLVQQWDDNKIDFIEEFKVLLLNRGNRVLGIVNISTGGITGTVADPRLIFVAALKANATGILLSHNHPSGNLQPSKEDQNLTGKIKEAGDFLDIKVLDHLIVSRNGYYPFADNGLI